MATVYYTASSVDGFIATPEHSLAWLLERDVDPRGPMGHDDFMAGVGALAMGAGTYRWLLTNGLGEDRSWPYEIPSWVLTHRTVEVVHPSITPTQAPVRDVHRQMVAAAGGRDVWVVGGGDVAGQFADAGLLDEVWVQYAPVTLGAGSPLLPRALELELLDVQRNRDFACVRYRVVDGA
ncbi:MAG: dihydrofolate reductase family protein [Actinotalea sp.]|nr:dihydrofolate reductase family protein [Actinotalea sp.]